MKTKSIVKQMSDFRRKPQQKEEPDEEEEQEEERDDDLVDDRPNAEGQVIN